MSDQDQATGADETSAQAPAESTPNSKKPGFAALATGGLSLLLVAVMQALEVRLISALLIAMLVMSGLTGVLAIANYVAARRLAEGVSPQDRLQAVFGVLGLVLGIIAAVWFW
jgi:hypothetical protein